MKNTMGAYIQGRRDGVLNIIPLALVTLCNMCMVRLDAPTSTYLILVLGYNFSTPTTSNQT